jgi:trans-2,3-dihydro-3-hydroxyanthranilate isomerase
MKFYIVDCFAEEKYQGNQLLVVLADQAISDQEQQNIATEINFSETTFILSDKQDDGGYDVRIWTPNVGEVPFAGHPTLGTAHVIQQILESGQTDEVLLNLKVGQISVHKSAQGLTMKQNPPAFGVTVDKHDIAQVFGISPEDIRDEYPVQWVSTGLESVSIPLKTREALKRVEMDPVRFARYIEKYPDCNCNHLFFVDMGNRLIAARCLMEDFVEDPATGSANGNLAGYFLMHNYFGSKDATYVVHQGEDMGRRSVLHIHASLDQGRWTIEVGGNCYVVAEGQWR